jgi:hypothetical protein
MTLADDRVADEYQVVRLLQTLKGRVCVCLVTYGAPA